MKTRPNADHAIIVPTAATAKATKVQFNRASARMQEQRNELDRPIMDALLKECRNLLGVVGAANLVLMDGRRFRFRAGGDAECANDVNLEDGAHFAGGTLAIGAWSRLAPDELAGYVDVVTLLKGLGDDGALSKEGDGKELSVLDGSSLRVIEPALSKAGTNELSPSSIGDRRLVGEVSGKNDLVKNFHGFSPQWPALQLRHGRWQQYRAMVLTALLALLEAVPLR